METESKRQIMIAGAFGLINLLQLPVKKMAAKAAAVVREHRRRFIDKPKPRPKAYRINCKTCEVNRIA